MPICLQILAAVCPALWSQLDTSHMHARYYDFLSSPHVVFMIIFCFSLQKILPVFLILMDAIFSMLFLSELLLSTNSHSMKQTIMWQSNTEKKKKKMSLKRQIFNVGSSPFHRFFCKECLVVHQVKQQASFLYISSLRVILQFCHSVWHLP